jgi:hypothetical protein
VTLVDELRSDQRCGCYADGAGTASRPVVSHHCVTCRAAGRIDELEAALTEIRDLLPIEQDNYSRRVFAIAADALEPEKE